MHSKTSTLSLIFLFFLVILYWNHWSFKIDFLFDSLIYISSVQDLNSFSFDWLNIFTDTNAWGVRYRPFGFFGYFQSLREVCGLNSVCARSINIALFFLSATLMFFILRHKNHSAIQSTLFTFSWILFFGHIHPVFTISNGGKYLFPLLAMLTGFFRINQSGKKISLPVELCLLSTFCIFGNESHLGVSFVFLLALWSAQKLNLLSAILVSLPASAYLLFRFFIFKLPAGGEVVVSLNDFPSLFSRLFLGSYWPPLRYKDFSLPEFFLFSIILCLIFFALYYYCFFKKSIFAKKALAYLVMFGLLIGPYTLIPHHYPSFFRKAFCLSSVPLFFLLFEVQRFFSTIPGSIKIRRKSLSLKHLLPLLIYFYLMIQALFSFQFRDSYRQNMQAFHYRFTNLSQEVKKQLPEEKISDYILIPMRNRISFDEGLLIAGVLAKNFPTYNFILKNWDKGIEKTAWLTEKDQILVKKGYIFRRLLKTGQFRMTDLFNQPVKKSIFLKEPNISTHSINTNRNFKTYLIKRIY